MKFTPKQFATAFVSVLQGADTNARVAIITRAAKVLKDSVVTNKLPKIIEAIENVWQEKTGAKKYSIISALPMTETEKKKFLSKLQPTINDYVEYIMNPNLVAGLIIKENDCRVLDISFTKCVAGLFKN